MAGMFLTEEGFEGEAALACLLTRQGGGHRSENAEYRIKQPSIRRTGGWLQASDTFDLPADAESVWIELRGRFQGVVRVKEVSVTVR